MALLIDTGILYAYYDRSDRWHPAARALLEAERGLVVPAPVVPEVDYLLWRRVGAAARARLYQGLAGGHYFVADLPRDAYARVAELNLRYAELELGFVDAAVLALAEHLELGRIATTDRRHFGAVAAEIPLEIVPDEPG